jgi:hypothetical protein
MENAPPKYISNKVYLLYNVRGDILHAHRVVSVAGGKVITDEDVEKRAKAQAKAAGHDVTVLSGLAVPGDKYDSSSHYRIDVAAKKLVKSEGYPDRPNEPSGRSS